MPTFCRHNRFIQNCPICREPEPPAKASRAPRKTSGTGTRARSGGGGSSAVRVRRAVRAADDGYRSDLVPGLRSSEDARRLADELGFATARLAELAAAPPGLYAEAASEPDREEALWLVVLVSLLGPVDDAGDPFAGVRAARVPWAGGEVPSLEGVPLGPRGGVRSAADGERALAAYREWAGRAGGQSTALGGEPAWTPERRFERAFERLGALRGFARNARFDLLVAVGRLGLLDARAAALHLDGGDAASLAARRVFGIADRFLLERRAADLTEAAEVPLEALDLALANFGEGERARQGASPETGDEDAAARAAGALGV